MLSAMRSSFFGLGATLFILLSSHASGQDGCYFGVCPGDPGTEFPTTPTVSLPPTVELPAPEPVPMPTPEPTGKTKPGKKPGPQPEVAQSAVEVLCRSAFMVGGEFHWDPRMTIRNAMAVCEAALREKPDDLDLQFFYAAARDVWAQWGNGTPADDYYAVTAYRALAEKGHALGEYALGTMYDEDAGVTKADGIAISARAINGEFGSGVACQTYISVLAADDLAAAGLTFDAELMAKYSEESVSCSDSVLSALAYVEPAEFQTPLKLEHYARVAAMTGSGWGMYYLGSFYAIGSEGTYSPIFTGRVSLHRDWERGGRWLLLHYWWSMQRTDRAAKVAEWLPTAFQGEPAMAIQTALKSLGYYSGGIDGQLGPQSKAALAAFVASGTADALFQRLRSDEPQHPMLPVPPPVRLGNAALEHFSAPVAAR